ncbi:MAG: hypothetical protein P4L67_04800 [Candidatus Pacebacteria bacterium]|nr:hypothetical protein [Candidatus Paceibacterota bacterium]
MGAKNRQGCCCGSSPQCLNGCKACDGQYLKNGVVTDDLGVYALKQPTPMASGGRPWQTDWIAWTTDDWTSGDCVRKTGVAYYRYELTCIDDVLLTDPSRGGMQLTVRYSVSTCPAGVRLFNASQPGDSSGSIDARSIPHDSIACDPITATFAIVQQFGLPAPWLNPVIAFDVDAAATLRCPCRNCGGAAGSSGVAQGFYPDGDVVLSYNIKDESIAEENRVGSVRLTKTPIFNNDGTQNYRWIGNVDWWNQPSYTNPTNAPGGHNVQLECGGLAFLKWGYGIVAGPRTYYASSGGIGAQTFNLIAADGSKNGSVNTKDAPDAVLKGRCCWPCDLPKKDLVLTYIEVRTPTFPAGPPTTTTLYSVTMKYSDAPWEMPNGSLRPGSTKLGHWRSDPFFPRPSAPFKVAIYFDCTSLYAPFAIDGINIVYGGSSPSYPYGSIDGTGAGNWPTSGLAVTFGSGSSCGPLHLDYTSGPVHYSAPLPIGAGDVVTRIFIDEVA